MVTSSTFHGFYDLGSLSPFQCPVFWHFSAVGVMDCNSFPSEMQTESLVWQKKVRAKDENVEVGLPPDNDQLHDLGEMLNISKT